MIKVAVIGVGSLGQHHARILAATAGVSLVGVADINPDQAGAWPNVTAPVIFRTIRN